MPDLWQLVFLHVIDSDGSSGEFDAVEIVHGQNGGLLILVTKEGEPFRLSRLFVTN